MAFPRFITTPHRHKRNGTLVLPIACILSIATLCGCSGEKAIGSSGLDFAEKYRDITITTVSATDTIYSFYQDYPVGIAEKDGMLFALLHGSDHLAAAIDIHSGQMDYIALRGSGPDDFMSLEFISDNRFIGDSTITMYDCNLYKTLTYDCTTHSYTTDKFPFGPAQSLNIMPDGSYAGTTIMDRGCLFCFYSHNGAISKSVAYPFELSESTMDRTSDMFLTPYVYANPEKKRILTPMYFMDVVYTFDDNGTLLNTCSMGSDTFDADTALRQFLDSQTIVRHTGGYATENGCYLMRSCHIPDLSTGRYVCKGRQIVLFSWDGNPMETYNFSVDNIGSFCVSGDGKILAIVLDTGDENGEVFHIIEFE